MLDEPALPSDLADPLLATVPPYGKYFLIFPLINNVLYQKSISSSRFVSTIFISVSLLVFRVSLEVSLCLEVLDFSNFI